MGYLYFCKKRHSYINKPTLYTQGPSKGLLGIKSVFHFNFFL